MPRRLGDDPLTRARAEKAKAAGGSTLELGAPQGSSQVGAQTLASYNDVFFQRRGGSSDLAQTPEARSPEAPQRPEISEISEIPEIREVPTVSGSQAAVEVAAEARTEAMTTQAAQAPNVSTTEETVAKSDATSPAITEAKEEPSTQEVAAQAPASGADGPKAEPQKGGFFKRLFGKFK